MKMTIHLAPAFTCAIVLFGGCTTAPKENIVSVIPEYQQLNAWFVAGKNKMQDRKHFGKAKNIILFVGDGMGVSTVTAARILDGQQRGGSGEENLLSFDHFPYTGISKTYNVDAQTPDSAGTMTAMITGVKTNAGVISVDEHAERGKCGDISNNKLLSALELAELAGKATGVVSTARITHATPAATYAKSSLRHWEGVSTLTEDAANNGCEDIASQLISFNERLKQRFPNATSANGIDVIFGGGRRHFLPTEDEAQDQGRRTDNRNLIEEWKQQFPNGIYLSQGSELKSADITQYSHALGLFNPSHLSYNASLENQTIDEPTLTEMTEAAIDKLSNDNDGFFLVVEAGRIDHGHHENSAYNALNDTIELSRAVDKAVSMVDLDETLIIVTADHSHVFTIAGYPKRGNPILGKVINVGSDGYALAHDKKPYTTLGYTNGRIYANDGTESAAKSLFAKATEKPTDGNTKAATAARPDLSDVDTADAHFHQQSLIPLGIETHGGEDVMIYANGIGSSLVSGTHEQNMIFHIMNHVGALEYNASKNMSR